MKINFSKFSSIFLTSFLGFGGVAIIAQDVPVSITPILDTTNGWDGVALPNNSRVNIKEYIIQPGAQTTVHKHLVNGGGYILDGELTMYVTSNKNGSFDNSDEVKVTTLKQGETWAETIETWHYGINLGKKPVKFIVTFIGDADTPQTVNF